MSINQKIFFQISLFALSLSIIIMGSNPQDNLLADESYRPLNLNEITGDLTGDDPEKIALNLFGIQGTVEGNFSQEIEVVEQQGEKKKLILTQMNLPDDSVKGKRYQLQFEFDQSKDKWQLTEAGVQQSCYRSDDPTNWTIEACP